MNALKVLLDLEDFQGVREQGGIHVPIGQKHCRLQNRVCWLAVRPDGFGAAIRTL